MSSQRCQAHRSGTLQGQGFALNESLVPFILTHIDSLISVDFPSALLISIGASLVKFIVRKKKSLYRFGVCACITLFV